MAMIHDVRHTLSTGMGCHVKIRAPAGDGFKQSYLIAVVPPR
jgi:hypothetical protein